MDVVADKNVYVDNDERRTLDLRRDGVRCIPLLASSNFLSSRSGTVFHIHPGCVEICLCLRGRLVFELGGDSFPFYPGMIFVSRPDEPHRMWNNPKGLRLMRILFAIPRKGERILDLPDRESRWLAGRLQDFPMRLFPSTERVRSAFERLFVVYDREPKGSVSRKLCMKSAAMELLLALVEAPLAPATPVGKVNPRINAIASRMRKAPGAEYPIEALAREAALSSVAFNEAFKRVTGLPPHAFLVDVRVRAAKRLLEMHPEITVAEAADRFRFSSAAHLATTCRQVLGVSPRR